MSEDTVIARLWALERRLPSAPAWHRRGPSGWLATSWAEASGLVRQASRAMVALGLEEGGRACILGFNRQEWLIFDLAAMAAGGAPAGIYATCSPEEVGFILSHAGANLVLVEDQSQLAKVLSVRDQCPALKRIVLMEGSESAEPGVLSWAEFLAAGTAEHEPERLRRESSVGQQTPATFIYTSGTTGPPKAVVLTHQNLAWTARLACDLVDLQPTDVLLSYLPLSHIAEQMFSVHGPITVGAQLYFAESLDKVPENLKEVRPTVLFGVPRIWEKMHTKLLSRIGEASALKRTMLNLAMSISRRRATQLNAGAALGPLLSAQAAVADRLVLHKLKSLMGLDRTRVCVAGAAPISTEVLEFFAGLDLIIHEVYGQSEDSGPTSFNLEGATRFGSVGKPVPGTEVRIAPDGEILVRGPHVFLGYFNQPDATAEALQDGWLHSGDLGEIDPDGFLYITGRKKEIIITAGGKNIAPKNIEAALRDLGPVASAIVIGDRQRYLTALLTLDPEGCAAWAAAEGRETPLPEDPFLYAWLDAEIQRSVNPKFARVEHVRRFAVLPREFSQAEDELTPTLKLKRAQIAKNWATVIAGLYAEVEP